MNAVYATLQWLLIGAYLAAPLALVVVTVGRISYASRQRGVQAQPEAAPQAEPSPQPEHDAGAASSFRIVFSAASTIFAGTAIGIALSLIYAQYIAGSVRAISLTQLLVCAYAGVGLIALLKGFDWLLQLGLHRARRRLRWQGAPWSAAALFVRLLVLVVFMLPFSMAATMSFRPKVVPALTPSSELGIRFEPVEFEAADGTRLAGWWIPAHGQSMRANETVIVVHGLGSGKADALPMAGPVFAAGYNLLLFDLRAHGASGGQFTSYGVKERLDVEAAAGWLRKNRPGETARVLGLGTSMGAAALLAARGADGRSPFDAVAVLGTYDDLGALSRSIIRRQFWGPLAYVAQWVALPAASAHAGCDLSAFRPSELAQGVWPSPVLVGHAQEDEIIPFQSGVRLYEATFEPKRALWAPQIGHKQILTDSATLQAVVRFFEDAQQAPRGVV